MKELLCNLFVECSENAIRPLTSAFHQSSRFPYIWTKPRRTGMCLFSFEKVAIIENIISSAVLLDCLKLRSVLYAFLSVNFKDYAGSDRGFSGFQNVWFRGSLWWEKNIMSEWHARTCTNLKRGKRLYPLKEVGSLLT